MPHVSRRLRRSLTLGLLALAAAASAHAQTRAVPPAAKASPSPRKPTSGPDMNFSPDDQKLLAGFRLTSEKLDKFEATTRKLQDAVKRDPSLKAQFEATGSALRGGGLADGISKVESGSPAAVAIFKECGTTTSDFVLTSFSLVTATMYQFAKAMRPDAPVPPYVAPENLAFVEANRPRIEAMFKAMQQNGR